MRPIVTVTYWRCSLCRSLECKRHSASSVAPLVTTISKCHTLLFAPSICFTMGSRQTRTRDPDRSPAHAHTKRDARCSGDPTQDP